MGWGGGGRGGGGGEKHACFYKTTREKIKTNQMDLKRRNKQNANHTIFYIQS